MTATVTYSGKAFTATIKDNDLGRQLYGHIHAEKLPRPEPRSSGSREAPSSGNKILSLADFGVVTFSASMATIEVTGDTSEQSGSIGSFLETKSTTVSASNNVQLTTMVTDGKKSVPMATPSALTGAGSDFSVTWDSTGP